MAGVKPAPKRPGFKNNAFMQLLNWLYPPACMGCGILIPLNDARRVAIWLCEDCEDLLESAEEPTPRKKSDLRVQAAYAYDGILRDIIRDIKFRHKKNHARALGRLWGEVLAHSTQGESIISKCNDSPDADNSPNKNGSFNADDSPILVPVPLHRRKERERGFNQAALLAAGLSQALGLTMQHTLIRVVDTLPQAGLHPDRRIENVADAFRITTGCTTAGKSFILVDDIYTTGASLNECARTLYAHGARKVTAITLTATARKRPVRATPPATSIARGVLPAGGRRLARPEGAG